jgi:hypothetical protein
MRSFVLNVVGAALLGLGWAGCGQPTATHCPRATGIFYGQYSYLTGTCDPSFQGRALLLDKDDPGNTTRKVNSLSDSVETETTLIGCTIAMRQEITDPEGLRKISEVHGDLTVEDDATLYGELTRTEYMPDGTTVRCTGQYDAYYTLDGAVIGSAAESALRAAP